jgi:hypothetical protein
MLSPPIERAYDGVRWGTGGVRPRGQALLQPTPRLRPVHINVRLHGSGEMQGQDLHSAHKLAHLTENPRSRRVFGT